MLALYLVSLAGSAGVVGAFVQRVVAEQGYVVDFRSGLALAGGAALAYIALQLAYMTAVRLLKPTRDATPLFCEILSLLCAGALLPVLLNVRLITTNSELSRFEPMLLFGAFVALHLFFKLVSFFATLWATPAGRLNSAIWLIATVITGLGAYGCVHEWTNTLAGAVQHASEHLQPYRIGDEYAQARVMTEGAVLERNLDSYPGESITMRWARPPNPGPNTDIIDRFYVNIAIDGAETRTFSRAVRLKSHRWTEFNIPAASIPPGAQSCTIYWSSEKKPQWRRMLKYRPIIVSHRRLLMSGPFFHEERSDSSTPNFVLIIIDGLGRKTTEPRHRREATPALDRLAANALNFTHAYTPAPENAAACMTILTGVSPLRHGFLGAHHGPLPSNYKTLATVLEQRHYVTTAFVESQGEKPDTMAYGSGFEQGFETYHVAYALDHPTIPLSDVTEPPAGSEVTLNRARAWIDAHHRDKFFVLLRLRELENLAWHDRYSSMSGNTRPATVPLDIYKSAVTFLDHRLGEFFAHLREQRFRKNTCIIVTSAYGYDFSLDPKSKPTVDLRETSLNVPLIFVIPGVKKATRPGLVSLQDIAPSILTLANAIQGVPTEGVDCIHGPTNEEPISVWNNPIQITVRTARWRFTWQTLQTPFKPQTTIPEGGGAVQLLEMNQFRRYAATRDVAKRFPETVISLKRGLETYLNRSQQAWKTPPLVETPARPSPAPQ